MKKIIVAAFVIAVATALPLFFVYIWPTQWRDLPLKTIRDQQFHQRQNRFTGEVETWIPDSIDQVGGRPVRESGKWTKDY